MFWRYGRWVAFYKIRLGSLASEKPELTDGRRTDERRTPTPRQLLWCVNTSRAKIELIRWRYIRMWSCPSVWCSIAGGIFPRNNSNEEKSFALAVDMINKNPAILPNHHIATVGAYTEYLATFSSFQKGYRFKKFAWHSGVLYVNILTSRHIGTEWT